MTTLQEMSIPRSRSETVILWVITVGAIAFSILAVFDLLSQDAFIAPILWLGFVILLIWSSIKYGGGIRSYAINYLGSLVGKPFAEIALPADQAKEVWFGFQFFGHRFVERKVPLEKVESVEWSPGQAKGEWIIGLWFKHDDPTKTRSFKPGQDVCIVGPGQKKEETEALGISFVNFLRSAGVPMVRDEKNDSCFVCSGLPSGINQEHPTSH
jgi:hypothetical protein